MKCSVCGYRIYDKYRSSTVLVPKSRLCAYCISRVDVSSTIPNNGKQYVGLELEVIQKKSERVSNAWYKKHDGSLSSGGVEIVLTKPKTLKGISSALHSLDKEFIKNKVRANDTCGLHIHLNSKFKTKAQLLKFIQVCIDCQESVYSLVNENHQHNDYCNKLYYNAEASYLYSSKYDWLHCIKKRDKPNSIEIRVHQGTVNKAEIKNWIELWSKIFTFVTNLRNKFKYTNNILDIAKLAGVRSTTLKFYRNKSKIGEQYEM